MYGPYFDFFFSFKILPQVGNRTKVSRGKGIVARDKGLVEGSVVLKAAHVGLADRDSR